jgi:hypothetical protein
MEIHDKLGRRLCGGGNGVDSIRREISFIQ